MSNEGKPKNYKSDHCIREPFYRGIENEGNPKRLKGQRLREQFLLRPKVEEKWDGPSSVRDLHS